MFSSSNFGLPKDLSYGIGSVKVTEDLCLQKKYETLLKSESLFFQLFCRCLSNSQIKEQDGFSSKIENGLIFIEGKEHWIEHVKTTVNKIRLFLVEGYEAKKNVEYNIVEYIYKLYFSKPNCDKVIDEKDLKLGIDQITYKNCLYPALATLAKSVGAIYSDTTITQQIKRYGCTENKPIDAGRFEWLSTEVVCYPIMPIKVEKKDGHFSEFYHLQKQGILCDHSLKVNESIIPIHRTILFLHGGPVFQKLLLNKFIETEKKEIDLGDFSKETVQFFLEYLYTNFEGEKYVDFIIEKEINPIELLDFSHRFQIDPLMNLATNVISLRASDENRSTIIELAAKYDNKHLSDIYRDNPSNSKI